MIYPELKNRIELFEKKSSDISEERKALLRSFAKYIQEKRKSDSDVLLNFICTHNSRRSHMGQIWAQTASEYYSLKNILCFSGGTEATAFNPRAVNVVEEFGFNVKERDESENPVYEVIYSDKRDPLLCFSKTYNDKFNPQKGFAAIMTCSHADENCPVVFGAEKRFPIKYDDPKEFDGTDLESAKYRERFEQIGIEMLYAFKRVAKEID